MHDGVKCDFVYSIEKLVLLLSFEISEICLASALGYHRQENRILILEAQKDWAEFLLRQQREDDRANASYIYI